MNVTEGRGNVHTPELVDRMKESLPQRRFVETTEAFCELLTQGYPLRYDHPLQTQGLYFMALVTH
jgi:hypothetical protein